MSVGRPSPSPPTQTNQYKHFSAEETPNCLSLLGSLRGHHRDQKGRDRERDGANRQQFNFPGDSGAKRGRAGLCDPTRNSHRGPQLAPVDQVHPELPGRPAQRQQGPLLLRPGRLSVPLHFGLFTGLRAFPPRVFQREEEAAERSGLLPAAGAVEAPGSGQ